MSRRVVGALPGYKCRHSWCPNRYHDVIGGDNAFGKGRKNATCIPCMYAEQMVEQGQTIEQVEAVPHLMTMFAEVFTKTGWTFQHLKDSYQRMKQRLPAHTDFSRAPTLLQDRTETQDETL